VLREKLKQLNPAVLTSEARVDAIVTKLRACRDNRQWGKPLSGIRLK
jgi:type I restriction enzyme, R subunit